MIDHPRPDSCGPEAIVLRSSARPIPGVKRSVPVFTVFYAIGLFFFYLHYVPLVKPFQAALAPILFAVLALTVFDPRRGLLFFIFSFPLINNLPYFFGIHEPLPHAPTALVLFLFFFLGWLIHYVFSRETPDFGHPVFKPMILFAAIVSV